MKRNISMGGKRVGEIDGDVYTTYRTKSLHFFRKFNGYGISVDVLEFLKKEGIKSIVLVIKDKGEKEILSVPLGTWTKIGTKVQFAQYDEQLVMDIELIRELKKMQSLQTFF